MARGKSWGYLLLLVCLFLTKVLSFDACGSETEISGPNFLVYDIDEAGNYYDSMTDARYYYNPTGENIELTINMLDIERTSSCSYDMLELWEADSCGEPTRMVGGICGTTGDVTWSENICVPCQAPCTLVLGSPNVIFYFHSDSSVTGMGWEIAINPVNEWSGLPSSCSSLTNRHTDGWEGLMTCFFLGTCMFWFLWGYWERRPRPAPVMVCIPQAIHISPSYISNIFISCT